MRGRAFAAVFVALALSGCVVVQQTTQGREIDPQVVSGLERGRATLTDVLARLGAPHEVHQHADGRLLIYRHIASNGFRLEIDPSRALTFVDATQLVSEVLGNLKLSLQWVHKGEDRLVLLFDRDNVLRAVGSRFVTAGLPVF